MSSFVNELTDIVNSVRDRIKTEAINLFIDMLKTAMKNVAYSGKRSGSIELSTSIPNEYDEKDEDEYEEYETRDYTLSRLDELLLREESERREISEKDPMRIYKWLIKEIDKTGIFKDIYIAIDTEKFKLEFDWEINDRKK
jgi:hypothetical protein